MIWCLASKCDCERKGGKEGVGGGGGGKALVAGPLKKNNFFAP